MLDAIDVDRHGLIARRDYAIFADYAVLLAPDIISPAIKTSVLPELFVTMRRLTSASSLTRLPLPTRRVRPFAPISETMTLRERKPSSSVM